MGMRVVRGPDWDWGDRDHDGGEGFVGTVVGLDARQSGVIVLWDTGHRCEYRCGGKDDKFDIRVLDTAQIGGYAYIHASVLHNYKVCKYRNGGG